MEKRLYKNEKKVLDYYFAEEIMAYKYNFVFSDPIQFDSHLLNGQF